MTIVFISNVCIICKYLIIILNIIKYDYSEHAVEELARDSATNIFWKPYIV